MGTEYVFVCDDCNVIYELGKWNNARKVYTIYCFLIWYKVYFRNEIKVA